VVGAAARLREAGIEVLVGVEERAARELVADFAKHHVTGLPFVHLKSAVTLDGRVATRTGDARWITGQRSRREVHRMRARADAILVASGTALADDPALTVRSVRGPSPRRVLLDSKLRVSPSARLFSRDGTPPPLVYCAAGADESRRRALTTSGAECVEVPRAEHGLCLDAVLRDLGQRQVMRLMVEAGPRLFGSLLRADLIDWLSVFVAPVLIGDAEAAPLARGLAVEHLADASRLEDLRVRRHGQDVCFEGRPRRRDS
jgi:diaminohydroxyphosphoribosylaminopyrimidine deaminase/5-amino-6-(5-phosphoribosylamino)uracil reductase